MIRERIKSETAELHKEVEMYSYAQEIMSGQLNKSQYAQIILSNYKINKAFEDGWNRLDLEVKQRLQLDKRLKVDSLLQDMQELGLEIPEIEPMSLDFSSYEEFMGALYVYEGSTLGGAVIYRQLIKNDNLKGFSFNFYNCYGDQIGMLWKQYLDELNKIVNEHEVNQTIEAAKDCFRYIKSVMSAVDTQLKM